MSIWKREFSLDDLAKRNRNTMTEFLGVEFIDIGPNYIRATMPVNEKTIQPLGILHGGASVVLAETLASIAANCAVEEGFYCVGSEINASHLRPATQGLVTGTATPIRIGKTQQVWQIELVNEEGKPTCISRMTATVKQR